MNQENNKIDLAKLFTEILNRILIVNRKKFVINVVLK